MRNIVKIILTFSKRTAKFLLGTGISKILPVKTFYKIICKIIPDLNFIEIQGSKMYVDLFHENIVMRDTFRCVIKDEYEKVTTGIVKESLKKGQTVLDIGANIGYYTLLTSHIVGETGKVFSFEPEPMNFGILQKNVSANNYKQANIFNLAVADVNGTARLNVSSGGSGEHSLINEKSNNDVSAPQNHSRIVEVKMVCLDDFLKEKADKVDFIKMDIEGSEIMAFKGMRGIINRSDNLSMLVEYNPKCILQMGYKPEDMLDIIFDEFKFKVFVIDEYHVSDKGKYFEVSSKADILSLLKHDEDYINLFLKK